MTSFPAWVEEVVIDNYRSRKIFTLLKWQAEVLSDSCLRGPAYCNLLYSAPTSSGKTVIAELLALNNVINTNRKAVFIFPYISVAREKFLIIQKLFRSVNLRVRAYMGPSSAPLDIWDAAVCTIEKANSLLNKAIDEDFFSKIGVVVIDEFHMLFDTTRGLLIEQIVSKLSYLRKRNIHETQIIGMSATIPNLTELAKWLNARCYSTRFRPIVLEEMILADNELSNAKTNQLLRYVAEAATNESERLIQLCVESLRCNKTVLVFCSSKAETERIACIISQHLLLNFLNGSEHELDLQKPILEQSVQFFKKETHSTDDMLLKTLGTGICFHHAGLTVEERELIEDFFKAGILKILCATSTLSSGVNLPADRVIIKAQYHGPSFLTNVTYHQMIGRAGRLGQSSKGDSILICRKSQLSTVKRILAEPLSVVSQSSQKRSRLKLIVEAVCSGLCQNFEEVSLLVEQCFFENDLPLMDEIRWLISKKLIAYSTDEVDKGLRGTQLGRAALASSLSPDIALLVYADLEKGSKGLILDSELHLLYLVTPLNNVAIWTYYMDWNLFYTIWSRLPKKLRRVGQAVGVTERFFLERIQGRAGAENALLQVHLRFISALALFDLINERPLDGVARKFNINRGALQSLQQQAATYACMVVAFCDRLGWVYLKTILDGFSERIAFGVKKNLTELIRIPGLDANRARAFHAANITTISALATSSVQQVAKILRSAVPFVKNCNDMGLNKWLKNEELMSDTEAAELLISRAQSELLASIREIGVFSEAQVSLLLKKSSMELSDNNALTEASERKSMLEGTEASPESTIELSSCDLFDEALDEENASKTEFPTNDEIDKQGNKSLSGHEVKKEDMQPIQNMRTKFESNSKQIACLTNKMRRCSLFTSNQPNGFDCLVRNGQLKEPRDISNAAYTPSSEDDEALEPVKNPLTVTSCSQIAFDTSGKALVSGTVNERSETMHKEFGERKVVLDSCYLASEASSKNNNCTKISYPEFTSKNENEKQEVISSVPFEKLPQAFDNCYKDACNKGILFKRAGGKEMSVSHEKQYLKPLSCVSMTTSDTKINSINTASDSFLVSVNTQLKEQNTSFAERASLYTSSSGKTKNEADKWDIDQIDSDSFLGSIETQTGNLKELEVTVGKKALVDSVAISSSPISTPSSQGKSAGVPVCRNYQESPSNLNKSCDLFDSPYLSSVTTHIPMTVTIKRIHAINSATSPSTPTGRSPLVKQPKYSLLTSKIRNPISNTFPIRPYSSDENISLPSGILDVCSSYAEWNNFVADAKNWEELGISLAFDFDSNANVKSLVGVAISPVDGLPAFVDLHNSLICGNEEEEALYPSFTPLDSIPIAERVAFIETLICSSQVKYLFGLLSFSRQLSTPPFERQCAQKAKNLCCLQMLAFIAHYRAKASESCLSFEDLLARVPAASKLDFKRYRNARIKSCFQAFLCINIFPHIYSLAVAQASQQSVDLELKAIGSLARMETTGIAFDQSLAEKMISNVKAEMSALELKASKIAGVEFNFDSPSEVANILFVRLKLQPGEGLLGATKRHYSTKKAVLQKLATKYEIADIILKWRQMNTALSASLTTLIKFCSDDGRIHASFFPYTLTGRMQSTHPNVQNVQKNEVNNGLSVRSLFVAPYGHTLVAADYCQLEMRVLTHFANDDNLKKLFCSNGDFFQKMADHWNKRTSLTVKVDRHKVKQLCYGLIYGMGAVSLSEQLGIPIPEARTMIESFFKQFPKVRVWIDKICEKWHCRTSIATLLGRKWHFDDSLCGDQASRARLSRRAVNYVIQGTASEIFKHALLSIEESLEGFQAKIVMHIHDEVIIETSNEQLREVVTLIRKCMCNGVPGFTVPLEVKVSIGPSWGELKEISFF